MQYDELPTPDPAKKPVFLCPFTGVPVLPVYSDTMMKWRMEGGYCSTPWYDKKEHLLWDYSRRMGVDPAFPRDFVTVTGTAERPPIPQAPKTDNAAVHETVDKTVRQLKKAGVTK